MTTTTTKRFGTTMAGALLLAVAAPSYAAPRAPGSCGPAAAYLQVTTNGCALDECARKGGVISADLLNAYCCVTTGAGEGDPITVCEDIAQNIDMIVVNPQPTEPTTQTWTPRPFGQPSRFLSR